MTSDEILAWAEETHVMIHFWVQPTIYLPGYPHAKGETVEEAVLKMQALIDAGSPLDGPFPPPSTHLRVLKGGKDS